MKPRPVDSELLEKTLQHALSYLEGLPNGPVAPNRSLEQLRDQLHHPLPDHPRDPMAVVDELVSNVAGGLTGNAGGRFHAWVIGGAVPASLAADWMTSTWDQNAGMFAVAPAASVVEEVCGEWLLDLLQLPSDASFALVTGCQMAHVTCLAAARNQVLARQGWDVEQRGLVGAPPIRILTGDQRHGTIERAVRLLGLGRDCIIDIDTDEQGQLRGSALQAELAKAPDAPTIVLLQAGDLNTGSFDPFDEVIPIAHAHHAWVHVDGAFGLWAAASESYRHLTTGMAKADSWATDGHKWLNVPYDSGFAFVAHREPHYNSLAHHAVYLDHSAVARDPVDWNPEYSRRARGFATYAAIASLGKSGIEAIVDDCCRCARQLVEKAGEIDGVEIHHVPTINQGLLRFLHPSPNASLEDHDRHTEAVTAAISASGEAQFACTTWRGMRVMRVSVSGWATDADDVERTVRAIAKAVADCTPA